MRRNRFKVYSFVLGLFILVTSTAYAVLSFDVDIRGIARVTGEWDVSFTNITLVSFDGVSEVSEPVFSQNTANFGVALHYPSAYANYELEISNLGTIDAKLDLVEISFLNSVEDIKYELSGLEIGDNLNSGEKHILNLKVFWDEEATSIPEGGEFEFMVSIVYSQKTEVLHPSENYNFNATILNQDGFLIEGAQVSLIGVETYGGITDGSGAISFNSISSGTYQFIVTKEGYKNYEGQINLNGNKSINIQLEPEINVSENMLSNWNFDEWSDSSTPASWDSNLGTGFNNYNFKMASPNSLVGNYSMNISHGFAYVGGRDDQQTIRHDASNGNSVTYYAEVWVRGHGDIRLGIQHEGYTLASYSGWQTIDSDEWVKITHEFTKDDREGSYVHFRIRHQRSSLKSDTNLYVGAAWLSTEEPPSGWEGN